MRCLVKNLAMFGLGIYIYAGEDMPQESEVVSSKTPTNGVSKEPSKDAKPTLDVKSEMWDALKNFCEANKTLGYKKLCDKIGIKYTLSAAVKNEIKNLIK